MVPMKRRIAEILVFLTLAYVQLGCSGSRQETPPPLGCHAYGLLFDLLDLQVPNTTLSLAFSSERCDLSITNADGWVLDALVLRGSGPSEIFEQVHFQNQFEDEQFATSTSCTTEASMGTVCHHILGIDKQHIFYRQGVYGFLELRHVGDRAGAFRSSMRLTEAPLAFQKMFGIM